MLQRRARPITRENARCKKSRVERLTRRLDRRAQIPKFFGVSRKTRWHTARERRGRAHFNPRERRVFARTLRVVLTESLARGSAPLVSETQARRRSRARALIQKEKATSSSLIFLDLDEERVSVVLAVASFASRERASSEPRPRARHETAAAVASLSPWIRRVARRARAFVDLLVFPHIHLFASSSSVVFLSKKNPIHRRSNRRRRRRAPTPHPPIRPSSRPCATCARPTANPRKR